MPIRYTTQFDKKETNLEVSAIHGMTKSIYNETELHSMTPELRSKAELINKAYSIKQEFDRQMESMYTASNYDPEALVDPDNIEIARERAFEEANLDPRYTIDTELSDENGIILLDKLTGKTLLVYRGANAGQIETVKDIYGNEIPAVDSEGNFIFDRDGDQMAESRMTETGRIENLRDWSNVRTGAKTLRNKTQSNYPELLPQADKAIEKYGLNNLESVVYSNGHSKGHLLNKERGIPSTSFDGHVSNQQIFDYGKGMPAETHFVRTNKFNIGMDLGKITNPLRNIYDPISQDHPGLKVRVTKVAPLDRVEMAKAAGETPPTLLKQIQDFPDDAHNMDQFSTPESDAIRVNQSKFSVLEPVSTTLTGVTSAAASHGFSLASGLLAGQTTKNANLGHEGNLLLTSAVNTGYDAGAAGAYAYLTGAPVASASLSSAGMMALPTLAAYETTDHVGQLLDKATSHWENRSLAAGTTGGLSGAAGGLTSTMTYDASANAVNAVRLARTGAALEESSLTTPLLSSEAVSAATETTEVAAEGVTALAATEETAAEVALVPVPGARVVAGVIAAAGLIGAGLGLIFGKHDSEEEKQRKALNKYREIDDKYQTHLRNSSVSQFTNSSKEDILNPDEIEFMNAMSPNYFKIIHKNIQNAIDREERIKNLVKSVNEKRQSNLFYSPESLTPEDQNLLGEDYMKSWKSTLRSFHNDAALHKLSPDDYQRVQNGESYESVIKEATTRAGYLRTEDYLQAFNDPAKAHTDRLRTRKVADSYDETEKKTHESFYSVDEAEYPNAVDNWTPDQSFILQAHNRNFTLNQFNTFMQQLASRSEYAESNAYNTAKVYHDGTMYTKMDLDRENEEDLKHFTEDLVYHGYRADAYTHRVNSSGIIEFQKNDTTRSMSQAQSIQYITKTFPRARIDFTNPSSISDMYQRAVAANTDTTDNSNVSLSDFWRMYSTQGSSQGMSRENLSFTITPKIREELENAKALGFTGRNDKEIYENYIAKKSKLDSVSPNVNENVKVNDSVQADEGVYKTKNTYGNDIIRTDAPMLSS